VSFLHDRIATEQYNTMPGYHPAGTADTAMVMPVHSVTYRSNTVLYGTIEPVVTADGATVPGYADVPYPATYPAGRP
jgi:hypothetical protein